ncbi:MAG: ABC transporter permease [Burkholderiales bacterium]|nr:ABC transporter permease [Burkholderiales bacterium]
MPIQVLTIARFALLEALRTRLPLLAAGAFAFVWAGSLFIHQIAITESDRMQWSFYAAGSRLASVVMLALYITSSMVREFTEKGLDLLLALDLPRSNYILGKLGGFIGVAVLLALLAAAPMVSSIPLPVCLVWAAALFFELAIVAALSLFCIVTLSQVMPAVVLVLAFYLLARSITAVRLLSETALLGELSEARPLLAFGVDALAAVVPALDRFAVTGWIAERAVDANVLGPIALQSAIFVALLLAAALFDFYRKEL